MNQCRTPHVFKIGDLVRLRRHESLEDDVQSRRPPKRYRVVGVRTRPPFAASREEICIRAFGDKTAVWRSPADLEKIPETLDDLEQTVFEPVNSGTAGRSEGAARCCTVQ